MKQRGLRYPPRRDGFATRGPSFVMPPPPPVSGQGRGDDDRPDAKEQALKARLVVEALPILVLGPRSGNFGKSLRLIDSAPW